MALKVVLSDGEDSRYGMFRSKKPMATERTQKEGGIGFYKLFLNIYIFRERGVFGEFPFFRLRVFHKNTHLIHRDSCELEILM